MVLNSIASKEITLYTFSSLNLFVIGGITNISNFSEFNSVVANRKITITRLVVDKSSEKKNILPYITRLKIHIYLLRKLISDNVSLSVRLT